MMTLTKNRRSDWLTWVVAAIAVIAIGTAVALFQQYHKEAHDTQCAKAAAGRDRVALVQLETAQRDRLQHPSKQVLRDVVDAINHYLATVKADDPIRSDC